MSYFCSNPQAYLNESVGDGQCVAFVRKCTGAVEAKYWKQSKTQVKGNASTIKPGTAIATFVNGVYANKSSGNHAAIYVGQNTIGVWVYEQWKNTRETQPVHKRRIRFNNTTRGPSNDGNAFYVID